MTKEEDRDKRFKEFRENMPPFIRLKKAAINGDDIILYKETVDGVTFYSAPLDLPAPGDLCKVS